MSRDIPIIFSAPMILALLAGRKTMTRRLAWGNYKEFPEIGQRLRKPSPWTKVVPGDRLWVRESIKGCPDAAGFDGLTYLADDLWSEIPNSPSPEAQERFMQLFNYGKKRGAGVPSIHMARWASRLTLIVTEVKVEPLQNMSEADAIAEGIAHLFTEEECRTTVGIIGTTPADHGWTNYLWHGLIGRGITQSQVDDWRYQFSGYQDPRGSFSSLWVRLHGRASWEANPEVVAMSFKVVNANIDVPEARAA